MPTARRSRIGGWPLTAVIAGILVFLFFIRDILTPFIFAAALAFVLTPAIEWGRRRSGAPRWIAATLVYLLVLLAVGLPMFFFGGSLVRDVSAVVSQLPEIVHRYIGETVKLFGPALGIAIDADALSDQILARGRDLLQSGSVVGIAGYGIGAIFNIILSFVVLAYFLISGPKIAAGLFWLVPPEYRAEVDTIAAKILPMLWRYFLGLVIVVLYTAFFAWIAFGPVFHTPHAPLIALVVGVLELIPLIGPAMTFAIVGMIAMREPNIAATVGLFVYAIILRLSVDEVVAPLVLGKAARLHPAIIIFAFLSGGVLFGLIGLLLAVPVAAAVKIILTIYYAEPVAPARPCGET